MKVRIEEARCIACGLCGEVCPESAVHPKMQDIHHMYEVSNMNAPAAAIVCLTAPPPALSRSMSRNRWPGTEAIGK